MLNTCYTIQTENGSLEQVYSRWHSLNSVSNVLFDVYQSVDTTKEFLRGFGERAHGGGHF